MPDWYSAARAAKLARAAFTQPAPLHLRQSIRNALNITGGVNTCSRTYQGGQLAGIVGGLFTGAGEVEALQFIHSAEVIEAGENFAQLAKLSTEELIESLAPAADEPLLVAPDGRIFDGNTRTYILEGRGVDIGALPRTPYNPTTF